MANTIRIKRRTSGAAGAPSGLKNAELAFNEVDETLYYGKGDSSGDATSILAIAGPGAFVTLTGSQTISGNKTFSGTTVVAAPTSDMHAATKKYVDDSITNAGGYAGFSITGDSGTTQAVDSGNTVTISGGTGLSSVAGATDTITINLDNTSVTAGSYGSASAIPTFTVDAQGRLTAAGTASISTSFTVDADSGDNLTISGGDTFTIVGGTGLTSVASATDTLTLNLDNTAVTAGTYGSASQVGVFTVDAQGRLTSASNANIAIYSTDVTDFAEAVADTVGAMVTSNTESGITVTYQDADNTLDFDVADFDIALTGDVTGTATVTNLGNVSISTTIAANSVALGTDTTGNYVADVSAGTGVTVSHTPGEGSTATISIGQAVATTSDVTFGTVTTTGNGSVGGNLTVTGNLTVNGTTTTINSTTVSVDDKNIELASVASPDDTTADGAGITIKGATDKTWNWVDSTDSWTSSEHINIASGKELKIAGTTVLNSTTLGSGVTASSLTSVGTISTGTWQGTAVGVSYGGTGATSASAARTNLGLAIGTDVQAYDAELAAIAGLTSAADRLPYFTGSGTASLATFTSAGRALLDDADAAAQRTTLGLGTIATQAANNVNITGGSIDGVTFDGGTF